MNRELTILGRVRSPLTSREQCPKQYSEGAPEAVVEIDPAFAEAMHTLTPGQDVLLFTWLHEAGRHYMQVHPRGDENIPKRGVFNTRSPDRPNPIGLHRCRLTFVDGTRLGVDHLEVLDGTPVVDIKSAGNECPRARDWGRDIPASVAEEIREACAMGWRRGLFSGFNGNVSVRLGETMVITRSGAAKGFLAPGDLTLMDIATGRVLGLDRPSTEAGAHLEVYRNAPEARAVVHTHPPHLLAHALRSGKARVDLPLFEAAMYQAELTEIEALPPGGEELAQAVGRAAATHRAVFMGNHGLVVRGAAPLEAAAFSEELDTLARIALLAAGGAA
ncbi:tRNA (N6-threonylcarbamoyladenosine(37)-N6)-methyltransferase TrmO [Desulfocurvus sp. DL9XJH121]